MARFSALGARAALSFAAAALAFALPQAALADPVPTGSDAVAKVTAILAAQQPGGQLPADEQVLSATYAPDGAHVTYRQAYDEPATPTFDHNSGSDDWVMRADGTQSTRITTTYTWANSASAPYFVRDAVWSPDGTRLAYVTSGGGYPNTLRTRKVTTTAAGDDWSGSQDFTDSRQFSDYTYTPDSRWLVYRAGDQSAVIDYAINVDSGTRYLARLRHPDETAWTWADACATVTEGAYTPPINSGNDVIDALAGTDPACKFGVAPDPSQPTGTTPTTGSGPTSGITSGSHASSTLTDTSGVSSTATGHAVTPPSTVAPLIPGPTLKITDIGTGLASARSKGLHIKYSLDRLATVKVWVVLTGTGARYSADEAFAGVPAATIARGSIVSSKPGNGSLYAKFDAKGKSKLEDVSRITLQVRMTATDVAGHATTVVKSVKLRR